MNEKEFHCSNFWPERRLRRAILFLCAPTLACLHGCSPPEVDNPREEDLSRLLELSEECYRNTCSKPFWDQQACLVADDLLFEIEIEHQRETQSAIADPSFNRSRSMLAESYLISLELAAGISTREVIICDNPVDYRGAASVSGEG